MRAGFFLALVMGMLAIPTATVMACDCARTELPEAIRDADLAIVGTLVGRGDSEPAVGAGALPPEHAWTWEVERSRDPLDAATVTLTAWEDDGANCGVMFGADERWLILGYLEEGRMLTNGCMRNQRLDGSDPDGELLIGSLLPVTAESPSSADGVPLPLLVAVAAALLIGLIGAVAFRRGPADPA